MAAMTSVANDLLSFVTCSVAGWTGDRHFEIKNIYIYIVASVIVARLQIVSLDNTVLSCKSLVHF